MIINYKILQVPVPFKNNRHPDGRMKFKRMEEGFWWMGCLLY